ncbi:MAG: hypothetical protein WD426_11990 [Anditalea sp.]
MFDCSRIIRIGLTLLFLSVLFPLKSSAQEDIFGIERKISNRKSESDLGNVFRNAISKFSFEISTGAGFHQNSLDFSSLTPEDYPIQNISDPQRPIEIGDENQETFIGDEYAFPVNAGVRIDMFGIFTIGGGYGKEFGMIKNLSAGDHQFSLEGTTYTFDKLYGTFGLVLYDARRRVLFLNWRYRNYSGNNFYMQSELKQRIRQNYPWHFILEGEYGSLNLSKAYDSHLSVTEPYYGVGFRIEREFSEYTKIFIKPTVSFTTLSYNRTVTHDNLEVLEMQNLHQNLFTINFGLSINIPGTKRCKVGGCGVVMKHIHNGVEYRGSSIWNLQNRKVGQW